MATYAERKAEQTKWEDFTEKLGVDLDDIGDRSNVATVKICGVLDEISPRLRDRIIAKTTWREQDKPALKEVG